MADDFENSWLWGSGADATLPGSPTLFDWNTTPASSPSLFDWSGLNNMSFMNFYNPQYQPDIVGSTGGGGLNLGGLAKLGIGALGGYLSGQGKTSLPLGQGPVNIPYKEMGTLRKYLGKEGPATANLLKNLMLEGQIYDPVTLAALQSGPAGQRYYGQQIGKTAPELQYSQLLNAYMGTTPTDLMRYEREASQQNIADLLRMVEERKGLHADIAPGFSGTGELARTLSELAAVEDLQKAIMGERTALAGKERKTIEDLMALYGATSEKGAALPSKYAQESIQLFKALGLPEKETAEYRQEYGKMLTGQQKAIGDILASLGQGRQLPGQMFAEEPSGTERLLGQLGASIAGMSNEDLNALWNTVSGVGSSLGNIIGDIFSSEG